MSDTSEIIEERGEYRAVIDIDQWPSEPENEYGCPVLRVEPSGYGGGLVTSTGYGSESYKHDGIRQGGIDALQHFVSNHGWSEGIEVFERWLRIFHNGDVATYSGHRGDDPTYVAYLTEAMARDCWGWTAEQVEGKLKAELVEWEAYCEGDVYLVTVERKVKVNSTTTTLDGEYLAETSVEKWAEEEGPIGGYYGERYAREAALEMLDAYAPKVGASA